MIPDPDSSLADTTTRTAPAARLPLSGRSRTRDRSHLRLVARPEVAAETDLQLDRRLRALSGRASRCRLAEGWLAAALLRRRGWFPLGFVRLGDYASERLGLGARTLEEEARVASRLQQLPKITEAFLGGSLTWTAVRLIVLVATDRDEDGWIERASSLDTRALSEQVRAAAASASAADPSASTPTSSTEEEEDADDPRRRWTVRVSPGGRRLWQAACEMASRTAGARLTPAQVLELVAAEVSSGDAGGMFGRSHPGADGVWQGDAAAGQPSAAGSAPWPPDSSASVHAQGSPSSATSAPASHVSSSEPPTASSRAASSETSSAASYATSSEPPSAASHGPSSEPPSATSRVTSSETSSATSSAANGRVRANLAQLLAAEIERTAGAPETRRLPHLSLDAARELEERDPELAAFFAGMLTDDDGDGESDDAETASAPAPPEDGWFEKALREIGLAEGFAWLTDLSAPEPTTPLERLEAEFRAIENADPHTIDARLREVRAAAQALDFEFSGLLDEAVRRRLHRRFGMTNFEQYVETRLGFRPRTAWSLLSIGRTVRRCCPLLGEAWRSGRVSTLAARVLLPVLGSANAGGSHTGSTNADNTDTASTASGSTNAENTSADHTDTASTDSDSTNDGNTDTTSRNTDEEWIARAGMVTLRRLEAEVNWALDRRDEFRAGRTGTGGTTDGEGGTGVESATDGEGGTGVAGTTDGACGPGAGSTADGAGRTGAGRATDEATSGAAHTIAPPPLDLDLTGHALAAITRNGLQMRAHSTDPDPAAARHHPGVEITLYAPESVILLAESTIHGLRRGVESRGRAFERLLALALLERMSAPKHRDPVFERDGWTCAVPGCRSRRNLHDHHVVFRSHGGDNNRDNRITVCAAHHLHGIHRGRIRASGRAPHAVQWEIGCRFGVHAGQPLARLVGDRYVDRD